MNTKTPEEIFSRKLELVQKARKLLEAGDSWITRANYRRAITELRKARIKKEVTK